MTPKELQIAASFRIAGPRGRGVVLGLGKLVTIQFRGLRPCIDLLRAGPGVTWRRHSARNLHAALNHAGLTIAVEAGGRIVARLGRDARPTAIGRILRLPGVEVGWLGFGLALLSATSWA